jgi:hypothetical protein
MTVIIYLIYLFWKYWNCKNKAMMSFGKAIVDKKPAYVFPYRGEKYNLRKGILQDKWRKDLGYEKNN